MRLVMSFHDSLFPLDIALNSEGGPERRTTIVTLESGFEERNSPWAGSRRRYNAGYGVKSIKDIEAIIAFFEARHGRLYSFRFRDPFDHKSCSITDEISADDQQIGVGDDTTKEFQLFKTYSQGDGQYVRPITRPVEGTILVMVDGVLREENTDFTVNASNGTLIFTSAPQAGHIITAGYMFDTQVRFEQDQLQISLAAFKAGDIPNISLVEVLS